MKRSYEQYCGLARALDLVGERWTMLIVRELLLGSRRFSELNRALAGISPNLLTTRLKEMEASELIEKRGRQYRLTEFGWQLEQPLFALARWGTQTMKGGPKEGEVMDIGWLLLSTIRAYRGGVQTVIEMSVAERFFELEFTLERMYVTEGEAKRPVVRVEAADVRQVGQVFKNGKSWNEFLKVEGDLKIWEEVLESIS